LVLAKRVCHGRPSLGIIYVDVVALAQSSQEDLAAGARVMQKVANVSWEIKARFIYFD